MAELVRLLILTSPTTQTCHILSLFDFVGFLFIVKIFPVTFIFFNFTAFRWYHLDDWVSFYFFALLQFCAQGGVRHSPHPSLRLDV